MVYHKLVTNTIDYLISVKRGDFDMRKGKIFMSLLLLLFIACCLDRSDLWAASTDDALVQRLRQTAGGQVVLAYHAGTGKVRFMRFEGTGTVPRARGLTENASAEVVARGFLDEYGRLFGVEDQGQELKVMRQIMPEDGRSIVRFQQVYDNIPVMAGELIVQMDAKKNVLSANGETSPMSVVNTTPSIGHDAAKSEALNLISKHYDISRTRLSVDDPQLWIYNPVLLGPGRNANTLVWRLEVKANTPQPIHELVLVDAHTGRIALHFNQTRDAKNRAVYDKNNVRDDKLPGNTPVRSEGQAAVGIKDADDAYTYIGNTYDFYYNIHGRDSYDNEGSRIVATVRYCPEDKKEECPYDNAYWNSGIKQFVFGSGYASADDVIAHEYTHGVTSSTSNLFYYYQSGAIDESFSDVWGEFVDQTNGHGNDTASVKWLLGEDLPNGAIRNMKDPTAFKDPDKMGSANYYCSSKDNGGVHTNSGINNKAAYLMTDGDTFNSKTVTGIGIIKAAKIYYEANSHLLISGSDYEDLYNALQGACNTLINSSVVTSSDCQQVKNTLDAVEMNRQPTGCPANEAPVCDSGSPRDVFFDDLESGPGKWTHSAIVGTDPWNAHTTGYATSGKYIIYGEELKELSDSAIMMTTPVVIPQKAYMHFNHAYELEADTDKALAQDIGRVAYSTDNGASWTDAGPLFTHNGYNLKSQHDGGYGFSDVSNGYISSRLDLSSLAGKSVKFRFNLKTDVGTAYFGWIIDDVRIYTCDGGTATKPKTTMDLDGNGKSDILWYNTVSGSARVWLMNDIKIASDSAIHTLPDLSWQIKGSGDFNGDGKSDILWYNTSMGMVYIWFMSGASVSSQGVVATLSDLSWQIKGAGDFNGDGKSDILWYNTSTGMVYIWFMSATLVSSQGTVGTQPDLTWQIKGAGDFNGDGKSDILWQNTKTGLVYIWYLSGTSITSANSPLTLSNLTWQIKGIGDFNGDGKSDILWYNPSTGMLYTWLINGGVIDSGSPAILPSNMKVVDIGDFNGDGKSDICITDTSTGQLYIGLMDGTKATSVGLSGTLNDSTWKVIPDGSNIPLF
ncbi:bacillolysin [Candidatus Magnetobacterium bavaricum]|uniref:Bacillolysin n=1 Tax=Candidatus Magnetobacterium bavaricum TaxID=29290 RepID=A0A0F3GRR5_9BACT|nr:bacillolysin [Candidatus Magnetobacterium bavaricum]